MKFVDENKKFENSRKDSDEVEFKQKSKHTFVGTADYVSPEVLVDQPANHEVDLWALGCIIYQCFTGNTPFKEKTEYLIFKKILELKYEFPDDFPEKAKDLVNCLLLNDPSQRLGSGSSGEENNFKALKLHPFFTGIDFDSLRMMSPPYKKEFKIMSSGSVNNKFNGRSDKNFLSGPHKNTIEVIKEEIIEKKSPWFHYNTRKVVLYNVPKIEYIDPSKNIVKVMLLLILTGSYLFD
jgi:serine/threonine protein kinase